MHTGCYPGSSDVRCFFIKQSDVLLNLQWEKIIHIKQGTGQLELLADLLLQPESSTWNPATPRHSPSDQHCYS